MESGTGERTLKEQTIDNMINNLLNEREETHGYFHDQAKTAQRLKRLMRATPNWEGMDADMRESLEMICMKLSRIGHGNPYHIDSWMDIIGYASLVCPDSKPYDLEDEEEAMEDDALESCVLSRLPRDSEEDPGDEEGI